MDRQSDLPPLPDAGIVIAAQANDWRAAVTTAGDALIASGATDSGYTDDMVRMIDDRGPYVVIAPGLALAHARPGSSVKRDGIAIVTLDEPVAFGHPYNDPVRVIVALAGASSASHLRMVAGSANIFNDSDAVDRLAEARTPDEVRAILGVEG